MTATQATIAAALISSPLLFAFFEWTKNKVLALFVYRGWQAVFLANGQVYFGRVSSLGRHDLTLKDIYYLNAPHATADPTSLPSDVETKLIKLGAELHGPKDNMMVSRSAVLFTVGLKEDGQVVKAITRYKREGIWENAEDSEK